MSDGLLLGIDEGTTAVKAALFDLELNAVAEARRPVPVTHPQPGQVEQDPELILQAVVDAVSEVLQHADGHEVRAAGLDHQGESVLAWDAANGRPLTPVIVWQDDRQRLPAQELQALVRERSGLPLDPYFSAGKLAWLLEHHDTVQRASNEGTLRLGTVDAFLIDRLGGRFATDLSTASRTQLLALGDRDWDAQLLDAFSMRREWLPTLGPSFGALGELRHARWPTALPLAAQLVDQQAALAGSGAVCVGELKATYGTGVFVLGRTAEPVGPDAATGTRPAAGGARVEGLLPTVAWAAPGDGDGLIGDVAYALDGGVFAAGSLLDWLSTGLGLAADAPALAAAAAGVPDSAGVMVLPALAGLGAPWWEPAARGVLAGLHPGVRPAHIGRAALEAIVLRVADIVEAIGAVAPVERLRVDGGLTNDPTLLQLQANALGLPLSVGRADSTVLGAAMLAGVGAGVFAGVEQAAALLPSGEVVVPSSSASQREADRARWKAFVQNAAHL